MLGSDELCAHFMWMHDVELDGRTIVHAYKHRWTTRYLHLSLDGRAFVYQSRDRYVEVDLAAAIEAVFATWDCCEPTPAETAALRSALNNARAAPS